MVVLIPCCKVEVTKYKSQRGCVSSNISARAGQNPRLSKARPGESKICLRSSRVRVLTIYFFETLKFSLYVGFTAIQKKKSNGKPERSALLLHSV